MIRVDAMWLAVEPVDMRAGADRLFARVVQVFGAAQAHHGYLFANARVTRIKLLVHDGFGLWCAARRLNQSRFVWPREVPVGAPPMTLTQQQFDALVSSDEVMIPIISDFKRVKAMKPPTLRAPTPNYLIANRAVDGC